ncbi:MAG: methyltransferase domain-containing protein [Planctomycetes bacterium]|nr:methyltransferase domain-containing protein [Planctomycetota bacterium]
MLAAEVSIRSDRSDYYSPARSIVHLANLALHPDVSAPDFPELANAVCIDFGCGGLNPCGPLFTLLLAGARRGIAIDLDQIQSPTCAAKALHTMVSAAVTGTTQPRIPGDAQTILDRVASFDLRKLAQGDHSGMDRERLDYVQKPLDQAGFADGMFDMCFSTSVFEHLDDPVSVIEEMARIIKPGGLCVHAIDGVDHRHYPRPEIHPLEFLKDDSDATIIYGCNRIRPLEFAPMFEAAGFEIRTVIEGAPLELDDETVASLAPRYRELSRRCLEIARARYYLRRR